MKVFEYSAREIKMAVVGTGGAEKTQVQHMVKALLQVQGRLTADAADALAVALCHAHGRQLRSMLRAPMIGSLRGRLIAKHPPALTIDVNGVGYELEAPMSTFYDLPAAGQDVQLFTHLVVREDAQVLYGFGTDGGAAALPDLAEGFGRRAEDRARNPVWHQRRRLRSAASKPRMPRACSAFRASDARPPSVC